MATTRQITLLASAAKTSASQGSWFGTRKVSRPITGEAEGEGSNLLVMVNVSALTGQLDLTVQGKDPVSTNGFDLPDGSFQQINATGQYAIRVPGPIPGDVRIAWNPTNGGAAATATFSVTAWAQG